MMFTPRDGAVRKTLRRTNSAGARGYSATALWARYVRLLSDMSCPFMIERSGRQPMLSRSPPLSGGLG